MGNETDKQEVSQTCLEALCYMSVCIAPANTIPFVLEMIWKVAQSESWKAKMSSLEFMQTFVFTNFMSICLHPEYVKQVENLVVSLMSDERLQVRAKAAKILCGLIHSGFINKDGQVRFLKDFRAKIRRKMTKKPNGNGRSLLKFKKDEKLKNLKSMDKSELAEFHSGILGLCAMVSFSPILFQILHILIIFYINISRLKPFHMIFLNMFLMFSLSLNHISTICNQSQKPSRKLFKNSRELIKTIGKNIS